MPGTIWMLKATKHLLLPIGLSLLLLILPQMVLEPSAVGRGKLFPLFLSYTAHLSKEFPAGTTVGEVLDVLHNPEVVVRLFPIVLSVEPDTERGEHCYIITERLPLLGGLVNGKTTFKLKWTKSPNGYKGDVDASLGTKLLSEVRVNEDNGVVVVTEDLIVEALTPFLPYVKKTMLMSHRTSLDTLVERVLENRKRR